MIKIATLTPLVTARRRRREIQGRKESCKAHKRRGQDRERDGDFTQGPSGGGHYDDKGQRDSESTGEKQREAERFRGGQRYFQELRVYRGLGQ
jgi:hypothetical protein